MKYALANHLIVTNIEL